MAGSDSDATHQSIACSSAKFPNCIVGDRLLHALCHPDERHVDVDQRRLFELPRRHAVAAQAVQQGVLVRLQLHAVALAGQRRRAGSRRRNRRRHHARPVQLGRLLRRLRLRHSPQPQQQRAVELPFGQGKKFLSSAGGLVDQLVGGWQVSGIFRYRSGLPTAVAYWRYLATNWSFTGARRSDRAYDAEVQINELREPGDLPDHSEAAKNWTPHAAGQYRHASRRPPG